MHPDLHGSLRRGRRLHPSKSVCIRGQITGTKCLECRLHCFFSAAGGRVMSLFVWILLGLLAGFVASHLVNHRGEGMVLDILLGIVGAIIGGWVFHMLGFAGITRLNLYSLIV